MENRTEAGAVITREQLLGHWQGHRRLTRRVIEAFPEDRLFTYSIGEMRPFGALALEMLAMAVPMLEELTSDEPREYDLPRAGDRATVLALWDEATDTLNELWPRIPPTLFQDTHTAFGQYTSAGWDLIWYVIDNEIHHRGQGYVYLRSLGIAPPPFWERE